MKNLSPRRLVLLSLLAFCTLGWIFSHSKNEAEKQRIGKSDLASILSPSPKKEAPGGAKKASAPVNAAAVFQKTPVQFSKIVERLEELNKCYGEVCTDSGLSSLSGNDRYFGVGNEIKLVLRGLLDASTERELQDSRITKIAVAELRNTDGFVKEAALDLLSTQPPSPEIPAVLMSEVIQGSDAELVEQGLLELARYQDSNRKEIDSGVAEGLKTASPFTAQKIADHLDIILNRQNADDFTAVAESMPATSRIRSTVLEQTRRVD